MFSFTFAALVKDIVVSLGCFAVLACIVLGVLYCQHVRSRGKAIGAVSYKERVRGVVFTPAWRNGFFAFGLLLAIFGSRLVLVKITLALGYGWLMLQVFKPKDM